MKSLAYLTLLLSLAAASGCGSKSSVTSSSAEASGDTPVFSLGWSEYPSWSVYGVAHAKGLIHKDRGTMGPIEEKWGVDIELRQTDYDTCLQQYGNGDIDGVCITNMDVLSPSLSRSSVAVLPTSTSNGADACIVIGIPDVAALREHKVYGLGRSVSEYCFVRNLELLGEEEGNHQFTDMAPDAAAAQMQTNPDSTKAIMVWNPFVLQTLRTLPDAERLFDSSSIRGEIIDMLVIAKASLEADGGDKFACAAIDTYYQVSNLIDDAATRDETLQILSTKFAPNLTVEDMNQIVKETEFYGSPTAGMELFSGTALPEVMTGVVGFSTAHQMLDREPSIAYGSGEADLVFDPQYMQQVSDAQ